MLENGSTDQTVPYVSGLAESDSRVRLVRTGASGLAEALNIGIELAETELLARADADDIVLPGRFAAQLAAFREAPELVVCGTQIKRFTHDPTRSVSVTSHPADHDAIVRGLLEGRHVMTHASVVFRRDVARRVGGYWSHGVSEDWDFFLRMSVHGELRNLPVVGYAVRFHGGSLNARRQVDILVGMRFAAHVHQAGDRDDYIGFRQRLLSHRTGRYRLHMDAWSDNLYRASQIRLLESRSAVGLLQLAAAAALRPDKTVSRVRRRLGRQRAVQG